MSVFVARHGSSSDERFANAPIRVVRDEVLFTAGKPKTHLYLIESGSVGVYRQPAGRPAELVEFAFTGDVVGIGALPAHIDSAQAVGEVRFKCLPLDALDEVIKYDARAMRRYTDAVEREFQSRRALSVSAAHGPMAQVAAFLVANSNQNASEGRDPLILGDSPDSRTVATYLRITIEALANALSEFRRLGMIEPSTRGGLRLLDLDALQRLAN